MNHLEDPHVAKIIEFRSVWLVNCCPLIDKDDAVQELWNETIILLSKFKETGSTFTALLHTHLRFRALNLIRVATNRSKSEAAWGMWHKEEQIIEPSIEMLDKIVDRIKSALHPKDAQVLKLLIDPSAKLRKIVKKCNSDLARGRHHVTNSHIAICLGVTEMSVSRSRKQIKIVTKNILDGKQVRMQKRR